MGRKGSFDFHMPVIAKETTSSGIHILSLSLLWLPFKLRLGAALRNEQGWRALSKLYSTLFGEQEEGVFQRCPSFSEVL